MTDATSDKKRISDFSYGHIFDRSSSLNQTGNPVAGDVNRESIDNPEEIQLARDAKTIEACMNLLDDTQDQRSHMLSWLCSHKPRVFIFSVHMILSLLIWQHFFMEKYRSNVDTVPEGINKYYSKVTFPAILHGAMHVILFQMALLPLTMCRFSLTHLSQTPLKRVLPLNEIQEAHAYLGCWTIVLSLIVTISYLVYYGVLCQNEGNGDDNNNQDGTNYCRQVSTEIFLSGVAMTVLLSVIGSVSLMKECVSYEFFRMTHNLALVVYALAVLHTLDYQVRKNNLKRSQCYKWFASTLLLYATERVYMWTRQKRLPVHTAVALAGKPKAILLSINKPVTFGFLPGQYVYLRIPSIDSSWHPFSVISDNREDYLEFYIEVHGSLSWTDTLFTKVQSRGAAKHNFHVDVIGPFGNPMLDTKASHLCLIGYESGILPLLSACKHVVNKWLEIDADIFVTMERKKRDRAKLLVTHQKFIAKSLRGALYRLGPRDERGNPLLRATNELSSDDESGLLFDEVWRRIEKRLLFESSKLLFLIVPLLEIVMCGLVISWSTASHGPSSGMAIYLRVGTAVCVACFGLLWLLTFDLNHYISWLDIILIVTSAVAISEWNLDYQDLKNSQVIAYVALSLYRLVRSWVMSFESQYDVHRKYIDGLGLGSVAPVSSLKLVWILQEPGSVMHIWKQIDAAFEMLEKSWGDFAGRVLKVEVHVIGGSEESIAALKKEVQDTTLYSRGALRFGKPRVYHMMERLLTRRIEDDIAAGGTSAATSTYIGYCGGPSLGALLARTLTYIQVIAYSMKYGHHHMTYYQERFGSFDVSPNRDPAAPTQTTKSTKTPLSVARMHNAKPRLQQGTECEGEFEKEFVASDEVLELPSITEAESVIAPDNASTALMDSDV